MAVSPCRCAGTLLIALLLLTGCRSAPENGPPTAAAARGTACSFGAAVPSADGIRRLALIVGVGQYQNPKIPDLLGPPGDARRFYQLLTAAGGYGFPVQNVCLLLDEDASTAAFKTAFQQGLVARARAQDVVVVYYAGHGSRSKDRNFDEPDEWDETFMFHDARSGGVGDLLDDEFNQLLSQLYEKTRHITIFLDSCNSGTATRGQDNFVARFFDQPDDTESTTDVTMARGDGGSAWVPDSMPGVIAFTAASDGTPALERNGRGVFTDALLTVLAKADDQPLTYTQAARQIRPLVAAESYQIPYFQGQLETGIFGNAPHERPLAWEVVEVGSQIQLSGPPLPGLGTGAELRLLDGGITGSATRDPAQAKATVVIDRFSGVNATARVITRRPGTTPVPGDLAVLVRPADSYLQIRVSLRPADQPGGISRDMAEQLEAALAAHPDASKTLRLVRSDGDFELSLGGDGGLIVKGPENRARARLNSAASAIDNLWQHARQRALRQLRGEGGTDFRDQHSLEVQLVPARKQPACAKGSWEQAGPNREQIVPLCHRWNIKVRLRADAPAPLLVGGVILSTDGSSLGFPSDGRSVRLQPGESTVFAGRNETFMGIPPLDVSDQVMVFGTKETNPVPWHLLTASADARLGEKSGLYRALDRYLIPGARAVSVAEDRADETTWTLSSLTLRVQANADFLRGDPETPPQQREYTIKNFDIRPYLPDASDSALYQVLQKADWLARASAEDGFSYKQHSWSQPSDVENLNLGIDCSRSIWFAFTRSGLPYNRADAYLTTAQMVAPDSRMADEFERCDTAGELQLGDILVYRDPGRGDGHVVMVIDPEKRIAWGSHGWDGNAKALQIEPDTGVEYQLIKYKTDWARWDRRTMVRKACWRYRRFAAENFRFRGTLGLKALEAACSRQQCAL